MSSMEGVPRQPDREQSENSRRSFIEEIKANLLDREAKLVYADFLEEQGDPRSKFIRNSIALQMLLRDEVDTRLVSSLSDTMSLRERANKIQELQKSLNSTPLDERRQWAGDDLGIDVTTIPEGASFEFFEGFVRFPIEINYASLEDAIHEGCYNCPHSNSIARDFGLANEEGDYFPITANGWGLVYTPNRTVEADDVLPEISRLGMREATIQELCGLGARYFLEKEFYSIVALGSVNDFQNVARFYRDTAMCFLESIERSNVSLSDEKYTTSFFCVPS